MALFPMEAGFTMSAVVSPLSLLQWYEITLELQTTKNSWGKTLQYYHLFRLSCLGLCCTCSREETPHYWTFFVFFIHRKAVPALEREYNFWMQNRSIVVEVDGKKHTLNRYNVQVGQPRSGSRVHLIKRISIQGLCHGCFCVLKTYTNVQIKTKYIWCPMQTWVLHWWFTSSRTHARRYVHFSMVQQYWVCCGGKGAIRSSHI